ncbi:1-(5-phosphoribosyl)-5-[(5-phosphoribosylamino)methylideneamino] imidazole-4-carboxamide isomerase HISN3, chloroplastic-like [Tasmannia lanceolata]|uniref:1-(5-phosphoribosyl)-5-[(5- phosphoribosylamino)methylideneamino] imidazole-4-carboxamide isomerase HISN3, chloroplastic-like n=1 Tax=Tasmannia lanceolata TaxID=3420 RepID=UPI0040640698
MSKFQDSGEKKPLLTEADDDNQDKPIYDKSDAEEDEVVKLQGDVGEALAIRKAMISPRDNSDGWLKNNILHATYTMAEKVYSLVTNNMSGDNILSVFAATKLHVGRSASLFSQFIHFRNLFSPSDVLFVFKPCIDIHKGKVKQIVGSTLQDSNEGGSTLITNFESDKPPAAFADLYKQDEFTGGHVIMLGADPSSKSAAIEALHAHPGGLQVGGGINSDNALSYLGEGASHVIVTSYVFSNGGMDLERLKHLVNMIGKQRLVLDLSCRKKNGKYPIVTDRWQKFSNVFLDEKTLDFLASFANEFLVHGVDVEGKRLGIDEELVALLGQYSPISVTYAVGVTTMTDLERIKMAGMGRVEVTVGSALDIFGGDLPYEDVVAWHEEQAMAVQ